MQSDSSDVTACYWRLIKCQVAFNDPAWDPSHVILQFYGKESRKNVQDGIFFVIMQQENSFLYKLKAFNYVKDYGIFSITSAP